MSSSWFLFVFYSRIWLCFVVFIGIARKISSFFVFGEVVWLVVWFFVVVSF